MTHLEVDAVEALLPQTQCELCEYPGCRPYAQAIVQKGEAIDRCLPGGVETLIRLGAITNQDPLPMVPDMEAKYKAPSIARIREEACIGCTKCIKACPVDAIIGGAKSMHVIITDHCTGCELCVPPCPTDCIDILPIPEPEKAEKHTRAQLAKQRFDKRNTRLKVEEQADTKKGLRSKINTQAGKNQKMAIIHAAIAREKARKNQKDS